MVEPRSKTLYWKNVVKYDRNKHVHHGGGTSCAELQQLVRGGGAGVEWVGPNKIEVHNKGILISIFYRRYKSVFRENVILYVPVCIRLITRWSKHTRDVRGGSKKSSLPPPQGKRNEMNNNLGYQGALQGCLTTPELMLEPSTLPHKRCAAFMKT